VLASKKVRTNKKGTTSKKGRGQQKRPRPTERHDQQPGPDSSKKGAAN